ncbi:AAA family ATPase [Borreliella bissettiae]|uniref:nucleotide-binding protein n=1 Tax=Borrelia bissettiae TaxID=64897 RepID=UPI001E3FEC0F|nr:AAA family ATPase [Borreliella bissettiae]MCD2401644.1 AAA family ATPase [Borreliella bissettiae]
MDRKRAKIIPVASIKGKAKKNKSVIVLAKLLSKEYSVLLTDIDTQAQNTSYFYKKVKENNIYLKIKNICKVLKDNLDIKNTVVNVGKNLNLISNYLKLHS